MASVKTAISVDGALFKEVERLSHKLGISRSRFFARAAREFLRRHHGRELLDRLNEVYRDGPDAEERELQARLWDYQRRRLRERE